MNKDNAKDYLPLVQALAEGKVIQVAGSDGWEYWEDIEDVAFSRPAGDYRIKPEPREIWMIRYKGGSESGPYSDKGAAECFALHDYEYSIVGYREIIE